MPEMDGYMFIQRVRRLSPAEGGTRVALTAYVQREDVEKALARGSKRTSRNP